MRTIDHRLCHPSNDAPRTDLTANLPPIWNASGASVGNRTH
jgi:hypothetical protein